VTNVREIKEPLVFVCEGPSDCNFVKAFVEHHLLTGIQAICPTEQDGGGGFFAIPKLLEAFRQVQGGQHEPVWF